MLRFMVKEIISINLMKSGFLLVYDFVRQVELNMSLLLNGGETPVILIFKESEHRTCTVWNKCAKSISILG